MSSPVLIIGAGLGGLLLAQGLKRANIPFRIFERDAASDWRTQGYRIRIGGEGIEALRSTLPADLWDLFEKTCAPVALGTIALNAADATRIEWPRHPAASGRGPRPYTPDRATLRSVLLTGLEAHITFSAELHHYSLSADGTTVTAHFANGTSATGTLLVGADGARSRVRRQYIPHVRPVDTDGRCVYGKTPLTPELEARVRPEFMRAMVLVQQQAAASSEGGASGAPVTLLYEPMRFPQRAEVAAQHGAIALPQDYVYWVLISRSATFGVRPDGMTHLSPDEAAGLARRVTRDWAPEMRAVLELQDVAQTSALRVASMVPDMPAWEPSARVTLLGDAAHVMGPTAGVGAVTAFVDAAALARVVGEEGVSVESVGRYEERMRKDAGESIRSSHGGGVKMFGQPPFEECEPVDG